MTLEMIVQPVYSLTCDTADCPAEIRGDWEYSIRREAEAEGWALRPRQGKGSRSAPDLCPEHAPETGGGEAR